MRQADARIQLCGVFSLIQEPNEPGIYTHRTCALHLYDYPVELVRRFPDQRYEARPGDLLLTPPLVGVTYTAPSPGHHICFHFRLPDLAVQKDLMPTLELLRPDSPPGELQADLHRLIRDFHSSDPWRRAAADWGLLATLHRLRSMPRVGGDAGVPPTRSELAVESARAWMESHLGESFTLADLAERVNLDPNYLASRFRERFGVSVMQHRAERRLLGARYLLVHTDYPLKAIARDLGFTDSAHLTHRFRRRFGVPPGQYRARLQLAGQPDPEAPPPPRPPPDSAPPKRSGGAPGGSV